VSEHATEIDVAGATAALEERLAPSRETIEVAREAESGRFTNSEEDATPAAGDEAATDETATSEGETVTEVEEEAEAPFTHIPDEALSPEMLAVKRAMQADYTRKTQEVAEYRKLAEEFEVEDAADLRQRLDIQKQLSDPENWPRLHEELTGYLRSQGLSASVAAEAAAVTLGNAVGELSDDDAFVDDDEVVGLPPQVAQRLETMEKQQQQLIQMMYQREQQAQEEARFAELARNLTTQENVIRSKYADQWKDKADEYIAAVYDLSGDSEDLGIGLSRLETMLGYDASRYLLGKEEARRAPAPLVGEGVIATEEDEAPHTLEEGHARAMEYERQRQLAEAGL
jgi:hypothetical protein